jgi:hypothetical protein
LAKDLRGMRSTGRMRDYGAMPTEESITKEFENSSLGWKHLEARSSGVLVN